MPTARKPSRQQTASQRQMEEVFEEQTQEEPVRGVPDTSLPDITFQQLRSTVEELTQAVVEMKETIASLVPENSYPAFKLTTTVEDDDGYVFTAEFYDTGYKNIKKKLEEYGLEPASFISKREPSGSANEAKKSSATRSRKRYNDDADDLWECPDHGLDNVAPSKFGGYYCQHRDRQGNFCKRNSKND